MIGITSISSFVPAKLESTFAIAESFGIDKAFLLNKIGVTQISRMPEDMDTSDLCVEAFKQLEEKHAESVLPDCIVVCTQNPDGNGIPHTSAILHGKLAFPRECACFDVSLGCSGYVYGLAIIKSFMESNGLRKGLLFTADPYSKGLDPNDRDTAFLFGDAATVTLLEPLDGRHGWIPEHFIMATNGGSGAALTNASGKIRMNGRAIFEFAIREVPEQIRQVLKKADLSPENIDFFFLHQGSKFIVDQLKRHLKLPAEKVPIKLTDQGNTISSSIPLLLEERRYSEFNNAVLSGFGVGLSWASCLLHDH
jgi:3-oxoacyl-[acyl-carrier-protein] synthase III